MSEQNTNDIPGGGYPLLLSLEDAALFLNLAPQTIYGFTSKRLIPFIKKGKKLYFRKGDLEEWLEEGRKKTESQIRKEIATSGKLKL
jgi:excisionase family DNA binding protein